MSNGHIFMAIPDSDFDKIEWIKADNLYLAGRVLSNTLELPDEEIEECDYRILEVPDKEVFGVFGIDHISRSETNFGAYAHFRDLK